MINHAVAVRELDRDHRGIQNDALNARELAMDLDRYVRGHPEAFRTLIVPMQEE